MFVERLEFATWVDPDQAVDVNLFFLPDSVGAICGLVFPGGVPPAPVVKDMIGRRNGQAHTGDVGGQNENVEPMTVGELGKGLPAFRSHPRNFIEDKYGLADIDAIHHYEITTQSGRTSSNGPNDYSHLVECNSDEDGAVSVSNRGYEQRLQDKFRSIRLLERKYLNQFVEEFEELIKG